MLNAALDVWQDALGWLQQFKQTLRDSSTPTMSQLVSFGGGLISSLPFTQPGISSAGLTCQKSYFDSILTNGATVNSVTWIPRNGSFGQPVEHNPAFPNPAEALPQLCAVYINILSSDSSSYNLGVFLPPKDEWNDRFLMTGNGGLGGGINWPDMGTFSRYGFAAASTDTGHLAVLFDGSWAANHPQRQIDWGYRAIHGSTVLAKQVIQAYYGASAKYSYYSGCSTGGRQGLKEIQMYPNDFDGVLAGAPAWWTTHLQPFSIEVGLYNLPADSPHHIPAKLMVGAVADEVLRQCDPQDGLRDGIISDPYGCNFNPEALSCTRDADRSKCLTPAQMTTFDKLYSDWTETNQTFVFPQYPLGSELQSTFLFNVTDVPSPAGTAYIGPFLYNTTAWDWHNFSYTTVQYADSLDPGHANANDFASMSTFFHRGGKLIQYHGLADGLICAGSSVYLYKQILQTLRYTTDLTLDDHYRFFLVPGMQHCGSSVRDAPWVFGGSSQTNGLIGSPTAYSVPGYMDADHDALLALMRWVENGTAPDQIIATKFKNDTVAHGVVRQRPLCPYPLQAKYVGSGDPDQAVNWKCMSLY